MIIDKQRLSRIADRKVQQEQTKIKPIKPCNNCSGQSFSWDFKQVQVMRTCKVCKVVEGV